MARLVPAFEQFFDDSGEPLVSGKLYFYETGSSTTLKDTFKDVSETLKNTNPVILNGDGRCPDVFGTGSYRVALTDKDSVQLVQRDPVGGSGSQEFGADWVSDITYETGDITRDGQYYYQGQTNNNRGNKPATDGGTNWVTWPPNTQDAEIFRDEAEVFRDEAALSAIASSASETNAAASEVSAAASEVNAAASESNAASSELAASTSAGEAEQSAIEAANSAASSGKDFSATSTTTLTIGLGAKSLVVEAGKGFVVAQEVVIAFDASNQMIGNVTAYDGITGVLDVNVTVISGLGTYSAWGISIQIGDLLPSASAAENVIKGAPIVLNASGTIQEVGFTGSVIGPPLNEGDNDLNSPLSTNADPNNPYFSMFHNQDSQPKAKIGAFTEEGLTFGSWALVSANASHRSRFTSLGGSMVLFTVHDVGSNINQTFSGTRSGTSLSVNGTGFSNWMSDFGHVSLYDPNEDRVITIGGDAGSTAYFWLYSVGASNVLTNTNSGSVSVTSGSGNFTASSSLMMNDGVITQGWVVASLSKTGVGAVLCAKLSGDSFPTFSQVSSGLTTSSLGMHIAAIEEYSKIVITSGSGSTARVGDFNSITGVITWGAIVNLGFGSPASGMAPSVAWDSDAQQIVFAEADGSSSNHQRVVYGTLSGTGASDNDFTVGSITTMSTDAALDTDMASSASIPSPVYAAHQSGGTPGLVVRRMNTPVSNFDNYIGFSDNSASSGELVSAIRVGGTVRDLSGLTPGSVYYVSGSGVLTTTPESNLRIGRAISSTELILESPQ